MKPNELNALSTAVIAFVTVIGVLVGLYYNLKTFKFETLYIMFIELLFLIALSLFIFWIKRGGIKDE